MQLYNLQNLKEMADGDEEFVQQVLQMTLEDLPLVISKLEKASANENWQEVFQAAHKIKPTMQTIGLNQDTWEKILTINDFSKNIKNTNQIPNLVSELCKDLKLLKEQLAKVL